ncbi:MAG: hypothetical protein WD336_10815 [Trueperaceae bacterium]
MSVEVHGYRFEVRGVAAGRQVLRAKEEGRQVRLEGDARFEGPLPKAQVVQLSRCHRDKGTSYEYTERTHDRSGQRSFRIEFDGRDGLVRFQRSDAESAETPYLQPFRDPLSMLRELRRAPADAERIRIPMLGSTVEALALGEIDLDTDLGPKRARTYLLHPGGSWAWIDVAPPHAILKLSQRTPDGRIDAYLTSIGSDASLPNWDVDHDAGRGRKGKRRKRRRRGRGGRSRGGSGGNDDEGRSRG